MRELALIAFVCLAFGLGSYRGTGALGVFGAINLGVGFLALAGAAVLAIGQWSRLVGGSFRGPLARAFALVAIAFALAVTLERAAARSEIRFDWTFEGRYELADATVNALRDLPCTLRTTLYRDPYDPRTRRTRLLLEELSRHAEVEVVVRTLGDAPEEEDFYGVANSGTVVFECGRRFDLTERPTEGTFFESISRLGIDPSARKTVYVTVGAGEGDLSSPEPDGYSGLSAALDTEGFAVRRFESPLVTRVPDDADLVLVVSPERALPLPTLEALRRYLLGGGNLVALLDPGRHTGVEELLGEFGLRSSGALVVDPSAPALDGGAAGIDPIVSAYGDHAITEGLAANRRTFFRRSRGFTLRKPEPSDRLNPLVFASGDSWLAENPEEIERGLVPERPADARTDYYPLVVAGLYEREGRELRIVAFGDSNFASNRDLRSLYNLDLAMNAIRWSADRDSPLVLRPKAGQLIQFPVPIENSLRSFYGVGLLVPELLLLAAGLVWLRGRSA